MLPETIQVKDVYEFMKKVLEGKAMVKRNNQILKSLFFSENLQVSPA